MIPIVVFPSILPTDGGIEQHVGMSDMLFLSVKEFAGKKVQNDGTKTTTGDLCTLTATTGKDLYLAKAKINGISTSGTLTGTVQVVLKVNTTIVETFDVKLAGPTTSEGEYSFDFEFTELGEKVAAGQIIKLEVISIATVTVNGKIIGFEEATGVSPFVASEFT